MKRYTRNNVSNEKSAWLVRLVFSGEGLGKNNLLRKLTVTFEMYRGKYVGERIYC